MGAQATAKGAHRLIPQPGDQRWVCGPKRLPGRVNGGAGPLPNWEDAAGVNGNSQLGCSGMPESDAGLKLILSSLLQRAFPIG